MKAAEADLAGSEPSSGAEGLSTLRWRDAPGFPLDCAPEPWTSRPGLADLIHPDDLPRFLEEIAEARRVGRDRVRHADHRVLRPEGGTAWWQTVTILRPGRDGVCRCASHGFDVTDLHPVRPAGLPWQPLIDSMADLVFVKAPDGTYLACNRAFAAFNGMRVEEIVGRTDFDLVGPERAGFFRSRDEEVLRTGEPHRLEETIACPDRGEILLETIKTPCFDSTGRAVGLVAVARDVTDKARTQRDLRESERRLAILLGNLPGMAYRCRDDDGWTMLFVSEGCRRLTGFSPEELLGNATTYGRLIHPEDRDRVAEVVREALSNGRRFTLNYRILDRAGVVKHVWEQGVGVFAPDGTLEAIEGLIADVSELKTAEQTLHTLSLAVAQSPVAVAITDALGKTIYLNPRFRSMTGCTLDVVPDLEAFLHVFAEPGSGAVEDHILAMWRLLSVGEAWQAELPARRRDGAHFWAAITIAPVRDEEGRITNVVATADDVTARRQAEEHLRRAQKMQAVGVLAGGVAHDFNNILTAILGYSHLALDSLPADSPVRDDLAQVTAAADRAKGLVQQLLAFSRKEKVGREPVDLCQLVREALRLVQPAVPADVSLSLCCSDGPIPVLAAPTQIQQVLVNLCKNAVDAIAGNTAVPEFLRDGAITVTLTAVGVAAPRDLARARLDSGRYACLSVADTGCGMSSAVMERIFEPFFTTKPVDKGTGLGLAAVHGIVADHGGVIDVTSAPGGGAVFTLYLPLHDPGKPHRAPHFGGRRVLLLDDERTMMAMSARLLRSQGFHVVASADSRRGLALFTIAPDRFDLVILGQAAGAQTWKLLTLARAFAAAAPGVPILVCAGPEIDREGPAIEAAGVTRILRRPAPPDQFVSLAARLAGDRFHRRQA